MPADVEAMAALEMDVSGISRVNDYRYAIDNLRGVLQAQVFEGSDGVIDGFMISIKHIALNMLGPCVARSEKVALAAASDGALSRYSAAVCGADGQARDGGNALRLGRA